ncbi:retropepsin-like aspartic protease [Methylocaldum sp.]|uniref:retropepsin-like aspartic protease family protein n=1 Tax=Methylocaldum sp. TaxID=1969727 RepID=UPI002D6F51DF|nr:retropepsin-like aspartic protease [Methylocaldum sp.]HYE33888.1 retropepsin-like aspartic protease [Methylocaldum sp.]
MVPAWVEAETLRAQLESLAKDRGFAVEGLDRIGSEAARATAGDLPTRLKSLLEEYNYVLMGGQPGAVERLVITSAKIPVRERSRNATIKTTRLGPHHQVDTILVGPNGVALPITLIVDTGASTLALPESMASELGFTPETLQQGFSHTASDTIPIKVGILEVVQVGSVLATAVPVAFFPDDRLQGTKLLGMSFLNRFRMTLDETQNELILLAK